MKNMFLLLSIVLFAAGAILITTIYQGTYSVVSFTKERNLCIRGGSLACEVTDTLPSNWNSTIEGTNESCYTLLKNLVIQGDGAKCEDYGW